MNIDENFFLKLYDENVDKIYRYIFFRVNSPEAAQDLTSDVFLKSWQYLNSPPGSSPGSAGAIDVQLENPRSFFYKVARNLVIDFYRQKGKAPLSLNEIENEIFEEHLNIVKHAEDEFDMARIKDALDLLHDDYKEVIIWRYVEDLGIKEIAQILEKSEGAVRVLLSRALARLKGELGSPADD